MPADECIDCEAHYPQGEGLIEGRCPSCHADFLARQEEAEQPAPAESPEGGRPGWWPGHRAEQPTPAEPPEGGQGE